MPLPGSQASLGQHASPYHHSPPLLLVVCGTRVWVTSNPEWLLSFSQEEAQKQKELAKAEIQKVLKEKDQLTADLSSLEKSFSDLFKRFEKQKEVIEGYRTVGGAAPVLPRALGGQWSLTVLGCPVSSLAVGYSPSPVRLEAVSTPWSFVKGTQLGTWPHVPLHQGCEASLASGLARCHLPGEAPGTLTEEPQGTAAEGVPRCAMGPKEPAAAFCRRAWAQLGPHTGLPGKGQHILGMRPGQGSPHTPTPAGPLPPLALLQFSL